MVVVGGDVEPVGRLEVERQRHAVALAVGRRAVGHVLVAVQQVHPDGGGVGQHIVGVGGQAAIAVAADAGRQLGEVHIGGGLLGHRVDRAAGGAPPGKGRARALGDFQLLDGEALAHRHAGVAQAIDKHVAARFLAADDVAVAKGVAVLAGAQRDAWLGTQDVAQVAAAGVEQLLLGQHGDGLRRLRQRAGVARVARGLGLVGHARFGVGVGVDHGVDDLHRREHRRLAGLRHRNRHQRRGGHAERQPGARHDTRLSARLHPETGRDLYLGGIVFHVFLQRIAPKQHGTHTTDDAHSTPLRPPEGVPSTLLRPAPCTGSMPAPAAERISPPGVAHPPRVSEWGWKRLAGCRLAITRIARRATLPRRHGVI